MGTGILGHGSVRRPVRVTIVPWLLALAATPGVPADGGPPATRAAVDDRQFDATLEQARGLEGAPLQRALAAVAERFQDVDVCTTSARNTWSFRTLNRRGKRFDAVRFTVPPGDHTRLYWAFSVPALSEWYIEPVTGEHAKLFEDYFDQPGKYDLPPSVNRHLILQQSSRRLEPGGEYVLWFKLTTDKPVLFAGSVVLLNRDEIDSVKHVEHAVGLSKAGNGD